MQIRAAPCRSANRGHRQQLIEWCVPILHTGGADARRIAAEPCRSAAPGTGGSYTTGANRRLGAGIIHRVIFCGFSRGVALMPSQKGPIRVLHFGLGPIGAGVVRQVANRKGFKIVGAVDIDPAKVGRDLGEVAGVGRALKVKVSDDARKAIKASKPDVAVLCTNSALKKVLPQIESVVKLKVPIVSTTEELAYPTKTNMKYARIRRLPFQQKIGAGLTREQFQAKVDDASVRHVGLAESVSMIADALGWKLDRITDEIQPKIAAEAVSSEFLAVDAGYVCGIVQDGVGYRDGQPVITLHMEAYLGAPESYDAVEITGSPAIKSKIAGGVHGDIATASIVVNSLPKVLEVPPGLHTMRDMPLPSFFGGGR